MTVMTAAMVQKYCAMEEMNGRVNPAAALSDSDEEASNGKLNNPSNKPPNKGKRGGQGGPPKSSQTQRPMMSQPDSEDEGDRRTPVKNVKQYQTKL